MLTFETNQGRFNFRVAGVALHQGRVLLHRLPGEAFWTMPGGRGELMEPTRETLAREMQEELGVQARVENLLWIVENFYHYEDREVHELAFYYRMFLPDEDSICTTEGIFQREDDGAPLLFQWHDIQRLEEIALYPSFLKKSLSDLPISPCHLVHTDVEH
ncbi:NUDIX hydrolase [Kroppenstedtia pulmonis]|uniref:NUDIX hydrolase n=1 Tax=Kroppenstedtia pulmonis TaxID=1380685 RepID=A0A7D3XQL8_9BACL|nr:NUDIX hydrolase [Kroppenstedtia pulmonis]QKG84887.1 NUDIX hydrolase [Kroppenstedtia pulmonis]